MVPSWKIEFHVHTNTSNFTLGVMLGQKYKKGYFDNNVLNEERSRTIIGARPYTLYDGQLYKLGPCQVC
jgi:hypothetical protein